MPYVTRKSIDKIRNMLRDAVNKRDSEAKIASLEYYVY